MRYLTQFSFSAPRLVIWLVSVSFVLFQFFLQLSSGVIIYSIMTEMKLSALITGLLSSAFYYVYTSLQIPVGVLFDKKSTRHLLTWSALLCSIGCFLFAESYTITQLLITRLIIGTGASVASNRCASAKTINPKKPPRNHCQSACLDQRGFCGTWFHYHHRVRSNVGGPFPQNKITL